MLRRDSSARCLPASITHAHTCGLRHDGTIECWGSNDWGQLDAPEGHFILIAADGDSSCGLRFDSTIECWGSNDRGQLGAPEGHFTDIAIGDSHACAVRVVGTVECWSPIRPPPPDVTFH